MSKPATHSLEAFLAQKDAICAKFEAAILAAIEAMGPDLVGVEWFSSAAERIASPQDLAA